MSGNPYPLISVYALIKDRILQVSLVYACRYQYETANCKPKDARKVGCSKQNSTVIQSLPVRKKQSCLWYSKKFVDKHSRILGNKIWKCCPVKCTLDQHNDLFTITLDILHFRHQKNVPQECMAEERERQAAADKLVFSICDDWESFSRSGQNMPRRTKTISSSIQPDVIGIVRWLNKAPILKNKNAFDHNHSRYSQIIPYCHWWEHNNISSAPMACGVRSSPAMAAQSECVEKIQYCTPRNKKGISGHE